MMVEQVVDALVKKAESRIYAKHRGIVVDNADPEQLGRLRVKVPKVFGKDVVTGWATPCVPYGGDAKQGFLFIPEVGAGVWVEFEEGDPEFPVWVGTFWSNPGGTSELPPPNDPDGAEQSSVQDPPTRKIIKTLKGHTLQFEDADGDEMVTIVEGANSHVITLNKDGITITDGANGHEVVLSSSGITITDGANSGNEVELAGGGVTISDKNGNKIVMGGGGIQIGSSSSAEPLVLGTQFMTNVTTFLTALSTHTHVGNLGAPTSPPVAPMTLQVPLSTKHKTE